MTLQGSPTTLAVTVVPASIWCPFIVICVPPDTGPFFGLKSVMRGSCNKEKYKFQASPILPGTYILIGVYPHWLRINLAKNVFTSKRQAQLKRQCFCTVFQFEQNFMCKYVWNTNHIREQYIWCITELVFDGDENWSGFDRVTVLCDADNSAKQEDKFIIMYSQSECHSLQETSS